MNRCFVLAAIVAIASVPSNAAAAPAGIAYDQVLKMMANADASTIAPPASFDADFQTASKPVDAPSSGGGIFGRIAASIAQAGNMMAMMRTGMAERHYFAGTKERTNYPATQRASILDCGARTITTLDLKNKTYTVVSLDQPAAPAHPGTRATPAAAATDDGSRVSIAVTNRALGSKPVFGQTTDEFATLVATTVTKADGTSATSNFNLTQYLSQSPQPALDCSALAANGPPQMAMYANAMRTLHDPKFNATVSGPAVPMRRLSLFDVVTFSGQGGSTQQGGSFSFVTERGNVRSLDAADPLFSVPADFTKSASP